MVTIKKENREEEIKEPEREKFVLTDLLPESVENTKGELSPFDPQKIVSSIIEETGLDEENAKEVTLNVLRRISILGLPMIAAPHLRELICSELTSKSLHIYRNRYTRLGIPVYDVYKRLANGCGAVLDQDFNYESSYSWIVGQVMEQFVHLNQLSDEEREFHLKGRLYIHKLRYWDRPLCQEWDLRIILLFGIPPINTSEGVRSWPAKNAVVAVTHAAKWLGMIQNEFSGGQSFDNFTAYIAPYLKNMKYKSDDPSAVDVMQVAQSFVFESNQVFAARGIRNPMVSISCTPNIPESLLEVDAVGPGGKIVGKYKDYEEECRLFFRALAQVYAQGDADGKMFIFPKYEVKITRRGLKLFEEDYKFVIETETCKMGSTYFINGIADWMSSEIHSQCNRLILTEAEMSKVNMDLSIFNPKNNFNNTGSLQTVTVNLPRAAYLAKKNNTTIEQELDAVFEVAEKILLKKKKFIEKELCIEGSKLPFCSGTIPSISGINGQTMFDMKKQVLSLGFIGLNECVKILCDKELHETEGFELGKSILNRLEQKCIDASKRNGIVFSLCEDHSEAIAMNFAKKDLQYKKKFAEKYVLKTESQNVYYTNNGLLRSNLQSIELWDLIKKQGELHPIVKSGVLTQILLKNAPVNKDTLWNMVKKICNETKTAYFTFGFDFYYCSKCGLFEKGSIGNKCSKCGADEHNVEWISKVDGNYSRIKPAEKEKRSKNKTYTRWSL